MKKRFVAFLLVVSLVLSVFAAAPVSAASSFKNVKSFKSGAKIDLYKGGKKETVKYGSYKSSDTRKGSMTITINGKKFKLTCPRYWSFGKVYYGDINKKDKYTELFVNMFGSGSDEYFMILRYKGKKLYKCAVYQYNYAKNKYYKPSYTARYSGSEFGKPKVDGKGTVTLVKTEDALGGCFTYRQKYSLDKKKFKLREQPTSYISCGSKMVGTAFCDFEVYSSKSVDAPTETIYEGETVKVVKIDRKGWAYVKALSGTTGWLYFDKSDEWVHRPNDFFVALEGLPAWD